MFLVCSNRRLWQVIESEIILTLTTKHLSTLKRYLCKWNLPFLENIRFRSHPLIVQDNRLVRSSEFYIFLFRFT